MAGVRCIWAWPSFQRRLPYFAWLHKNTKLRLKIRTPTNLLFQARAYRESSPYRPYGPTKSTETHQCAREDSKPRNAMGPTPHRIHNDHPQAAIVYPSADCTLYRNEIEGTVLWEHRDSG